MDWLMIEILIYLDLLEYKPASTTLVITRNPFGFVNKTAAKDNTYAGM